MSFGLYKPICSAPLVEAVVDRVAYMSVSAVSTYALTLCCVGMRTSLSLAILSSSTEFSEEAVPKVGLPVISFQEPEKF